MKQGDKRCKTCLNGVPLGIKISCQAYPWALEKEPDQWCSCGTWRDDNGSSITWDTRDYESENSDDAAAPPHIHWIRMEDEAPFDEKPVLVKRGMGKQQEFAVDWWAEDMDTWEDSLDVTHWAYITEPED